MESDSTNFEFLGMNTTSVNQTELTLLAPGTTLENIDNLCKEAVENNYAAVCVPPLFVKKAATCLQHSKTNVATVVGYPYGYNVVEAKLAEIIMAMVDGVDELNVVANMTALKNNDWQYLARELNTILPVIQKQGKQIKIVVEANLLSTEELVKCCDLYGIAGVNFLSLSSGFTENIPSAEMVAQIRKHLADQVEIMFTAHFAQLEDQAAYIKNGLTRIGTQFIVK